MIPLAALLPTWLELGGVAGAIFAGAVMMLCGRVITGGKTVPEIALIAGWGGFSFVLTLWGVATTASMAIPTLVFILLAAVGLVVPAFRPGRESWIGVVRILVLALPVWAIMAGVKPALPDTFTNFLPNAVYLFDHGFFPADDRAHAFAVWPAFPYNVQLATYLASLFLPGFPPGALTHFNVLLQVMLGLFFARILLAERQNFTAAPSRAACAGGLLLVTALNPGFVPRIDFTSYAEPALTVCVALLAWLGMSALGGMAERRDVRGDLWAFALVLVALVGIKQVGIVLGLGILAATVLLALCDKRIARGGAVFSLAMAALPGLALYGAWRLYVLTHFQSGELKLMPPDRWEFDFLPLTLGNILVAIWEKPFFFGTLALAIGLGVRLLRREGLTLRTRLSVAMAILFALYNAFLVVIYVVHMGPVAGEAAHSYFRYMTHLSLLVVLSLTIFARDWWVERARMAPLPMWWRLVPPAAIVLMLLVPIAFAKRLRFDLDPPQPLIWALAQHVAALTADNDKFALLMPGDNGSASLMLRAALELTPPRRRDLDILDVSMQGGLDRAVERGYHTAIISCLPPGGEHAGEAAMLLFDGTEWRLTASWPYPKIDAKARWAGTLSAEPFCPAARVSSAAEE